MQENEMPDVDDVVNKEDEIEEIDLSLKEEHFTLKDKNGNKRKHFLRELDAPQREEYQDWRNEQIKLNKQGRFQGFASQKGTSTRLLAMCLYDGETNRLVPESQIRTYSSSALERLHGKALKLSGLDRDAEEDAKND